MTIDKLTVFSETGDKNTDDLILQQGFPSKLQPARQWMNWLFNNITMKINEIIDGKLGVNDSAEKATKLETARQINGVDFDGTSNIDLPLIGYSQNWEDLTSSRETNVTYTNSTGSPIMVIISATDAATFSPFLVTINDLVVIDIDDFGANGVVPISFIIPDNSRYLVDTGLNTIRKWSELR